MKKKNVVLFTLLYIVYFTSLLTATNIVGDILSPILTFISFYYTYQYLYLKHKDSRYKIYSISLSLCIFSWFLCDIVWGFIAIVLKGNPQDNIILGYSYSISNVLLLFSVVYFCYKEMINWNKMQFLLDSIIITICLVVLLWVFIFNQNIDNALLLKEDFISMVSLLLDVIIFAGISIWYFSVRKKRIPLFVKLISSGGVIFVVVDFIYYYVFFYGTYIPNTLLDGGYVVAFALFGLGAIVREKRNEQMNEGINEYSETGKVSKELVLLAVPLLLVIFKNDDMNYLLFVVSSIMIYYVFTNYTQKNIFQNELIKREKEYIEVLEAKVEERTGEVLRLINTETITGLYSRRYFEEYLSNLIKNATKGERILLLYIEQNKYKMIKAMYGKYVSEKVLKELGERVSEVSKEEGAVLASYGDDIFTIALDGSYTYEQGLQIAERILYTCSDVYHIESYDIAVTLNIGIACYPLDSKNAEELIKNADTAMMHARALGFNKTWVFNDQLGKKVFNSSIIEIWLKKVKKIEDEFQLYYQPQVCCKYGSLIGFEALVRWQTKTGKFIPPSDFIPIAEETGIIITLGYWIMEQAISQLVEWKKISNKDLRMAINVSAKQLADQEFLPRFNELLEKYEVNPQIIEIEITENNQLEENLEISEIFEKISEMGVSIAVDDFGTGYSSLYYLKNLPVNRIKIAKELIDNIELDLYDYAIAKAVISIGKTRGIKVIAEGVENKGQWNCLKELECDEIQGYYFAKPMSAQDILKNWL